MRELKENEQKTPENPDAEGAMGDETRLIGGKYMYKKLGMGGGV